MTLKTYSELPPKRGSTKRRHRMRCSHWRGCGRRFTLKRHPDDYVRQVKCPHCKSPHVYSCESSRRRELQRQHTCHCSAYPFPHRAGSLDFCVQSTQWEHEDFQPTAAQIAAYERVLATPRSAWT